MSYSDYWDGDPIIAKYYREKYRCDMVRRNTELWLQGAYVYEAILDAMPAFNFFSKKRKPVPYRDEPMPLSGREKKSSEERKAEKQLSSGKKFIEAWAAAVNANRKKKQEQTNGS